MSAAVSIALYLLYFAGLSFCFSEVFETEAPEEPAPEDPREE